MAHDGAAAAADVLLTVPNAELHKVVANVQTQVAQGAFTVAIKGEAAGAPTTAAAHQRVEAAVGDVVWPLGRHLPVLKAADTIFSFALEHTKAEYLIVVLPQDTPRAVLEAVDDVLHDCCAFSTVKQLDAAAEEVDKLQGGRQAAALQAAEAAGAGPSAAAGAATAAAAGAAGAAGGGAAPPQLARITTGKYSLPSSGNQVADKVAAGLLWGGTMLASAVGAAATATAGAIQSYAQKQMAAPPGEGGQAQQQQHATVSPHFKRGLAVAGVVASSAAYVTGKLAELVGQASYATALAIAKSLPGHKKRAAAEASGDIVSAEERSALHTVGAAGLVAFVDVYDSLESAAKVVFAQSAEATSQYIHYKYGPEAGAEAAKSVPVAKDMLTATMNFSRLGARAFVSKTAKKTAKVYLKSTMAGIHPDEQAAGQRLPAFAPSAAAAAPAAGAVAAAGASPSAGPYAALPAASPSFTGAGLSPYPPGSPALAAAVGAARVGAGPLLPAGQQQPGFNTAAAQQAARAAASK